MGETIRITMADGCEMPCYHAMPAGERKGGLVLVQEIFGVTDHIRELCDEYAGDGYEVLSPGLFERIEPGCALGYSGADWERAVQIARVEHDWDQGLADTQACIDWLAASKGGPVFIVGYCFGGSVAWRSAQLSPNLERCELLLRRLHRHPVRRRSPAMRHDHPFRPLRFAGRLRPGGSPDRQGPPDRAALCL